MWGRRLRIRQRCGWVWAGPCRHTVVASAVVSTAAAAGWVGSTSCSSIAGDVGSGGSADGVRARTTDVLVIGGGIIGSAAAYYAAKAGGARVTLLERGSIASEASSLSAGTLACDGWGDDRERVGWFGVLCNGSIAIFKELEQLGYDCELRLDGALTIARTPAELRLCQAEYLFRRIILRNTDRLNLRIAYLFEKENCSSRLSFTGAGTKV